MCDGVGSAPGNSEGRSNPKKQTADRHAAALGFFHSASAECCPACPPPGWFVRRVGASLASLTPPEAVGLVAPCSGLSCPKPSRRPPPTQPTTILVVAPRPLGPWHLLFSFHFTDQSVDRSPTPLAQQLNTHDHPAQDASEQQVARTKVPKVPASLQHASMSAPGGSSSASKKRLSSGPHGGGVVRLVVD